MAIGSWLIRPIDKTKKFRLFCFSHAGGSAGTYFAWQKLLGNAIDVCPVELPGRGSRLNESCVTSISAILPLLAEVVREDNATPFALFGHSLGALLAFELARYCESQEGATPRHLFVSGCNAPRYRGSMSCVQNLSDEQFVEMLMGLNGTSPEILKHDEIMKLLLPGIRSDFELAAGYVYQSASPLRTPLSVLAGRFDVVENSKEVQGWKEEAASRCEIVMFDGGHFFTQTHRDFVIEYLLQTLSGYTGKDEF